MSGTTSPGSSRLAAARAALALAEQRTGLHGSAARDVRRALEQAPEAPGALGGSGTAGPWPAPSSAGALSVTGSRTVLLAAAARRQGSHGWCAVVGGEDLGWCAAAEAGLALDRTLVVPANELSPSALLAVVSALIDGVDVLLVDAAPASRLRPRDRRTLLARARERGALVLSDLPWEGARGLEALPEGADTGAAEQGRTGSPYARLSLVTAPGTGPSGAQGDAPPASGPVAPGPARAGSGLTGGATEAASPIGPAGLAGTSASGAPVSPAAPVAQEMPAGYLRRLRWFLRDPARPGSASRLELAPCGVSLTLPALPDAQGLAAAPPRPGGGAGGAAAVGGGAAPEPLPAAATPDGPDLAPVLPLTRSRR